MPSAPGYVRDYTQERKTELARGGRRKHTLRLRARRLAVKKGLVKPHDGKDLDHKTPLSKGGSNTPTNFRVESQHANRSFPRNKQGKLVANHPATPPGHNKK
jgi:hypothetical protein